MADAGTCFQFEKKRTHAELKIDAALNSFHWDDVERSVTEILQHVEPLAEPELFVDLSGLEYLGSAQLTLLVRVWKAVKEKQGRMVALVTAPVVREVITTAGLHTLWHVVDSRPAGYIALGLQADGRPRMSLAWPLVGLLALLTATVGFAASLLNAEAVDAKSSLVIQSIALGLSLAAGLWTVVRGSGMRRGLGVGMVVASMLLAAVEVMKLPR